jgi:hypothetical protein
MAVRHWKIGAVGAYLDPVDWVEGVAPGSGDTAVIADPSGPTFYPASVDPFSLSSLGQAAPSGDTIVGQTIDFTPSTASTTTPQFSNTTFAADTTINVTGSGTQNILAWFDNTFRGTVNIGTAFEALNSGRLELTLLHQPTGLPPALATNAGVVSIAGDSVFHIAPFLVNVAPGPFFDGVANFDNEGQINVAQGGELVESESSLMDLGPYPWTFTNNGTIGVQGGGNQSTLAVLETNLAGNGTIVLDGGTSTDPVWTQLRVTGNIGGGTFDLSNASIAVGDVLGSTVNTGGSITFEDGNSFALLDPAFDPFAMSIIGFRAGDTIALAHQSSGFFGSTYSYTWDQPTHQLTLFETPTFLSTTEIGKLTLNGTYGPSDFTLIDNTGLPMVPGAVSINSNGTFTTPFQLDITTSHTICFARGTLIATPEGEKPVELLREGDLLLTFDGRSAPARWIGRGEVMVARGRRTAATPVIVRKGALADNVPHHDLRITKGHSLFINGVLIPVEFLVNHRSILWDDRAQEVAIYHVELATHDVIVANGVPAESYRDDGNRWLFQNANSGWHLPPQEPCAPVLTGGPIVDAIWRRLLDRAGPRPGFPLTSEPDLHLLVDGQRVEASTMAGACHVFRLPACPSEARIVSRASAPDELGLSRDSRPLGVAVRSITILVGLHRHLVKASDARLREGFHGYEPDEGIRWTNGNALLPADLFSDCGTAVDIELLISGATRYLDEGMPLAA